MPANPSPYEIDIEEIILKRLGRWSWCVPRLLLRWLRNFIHQDFINAYLRQGRQGVDFCTGGMEYLGVSIHVEGRENLPHDGRPCIFVSNHPLGAIDGVALGSVLGQEYDGQIVYLVNDLLMNLKGLAPLCVPTNKLGRQSRENSRLIAQAFQTQRHAILFPAGLCSRLQDDGQIRDLVWRKSFIHLSRQHQRDVVPIHFMAQNSPRFYSLARWCKRLHLPNLAMALLPDEMYRAQGSHFTLRIGKPIPWQTFDKSRTPQQWAEQVKDTVYKL